MEETEELSHQRAQREVRTLFTPLVFNHMTATAGMDFWLNNTHLTHMALKQLYLCVCVQELERLNQVLEEEKMKFEEVVLELKAEQEHIKL